MSQNQSVVIVPAGGSGQRMGAATPKQYLSLLGHPVLWHTLQRLQESASVSAILLVIRAEDRQHCTSLGLTAASFPKLRGLVTGGQDRRASVRAGLLETRPDDHLVLVHDAVRPFVSCSLLERVVNAAAEHGAAIAALPVRETIKEAVGCQVCRTPDRDRLWAAQTPQGFRRELLLNAHALPVGRPPATDDAMLVEQLGHPVQLVQGDYTNLKITTSEDMEWAEHRLGREPGHVASMMRVGQGYDVHALGPGRELILGGVPIPSASGLLGHSDADVLTHAVIDALLGAAGCGDIGRMFPDSDAQYAGISSLVLLERVRDLLRQRPARIVNVDAVVMAQRPRLAPYIEAMERGLAEALEITPEMISVKATTTEGLGFVGREEGIAAQAVALVAV
jgi:2-C-methyl-D-erythritol 4-phosphate cytidylyltransferase / 2-C-methyl-D-erythritol 2,4-cyclodiphosphate synthase